MIKKLLRAVFGNFKLKVLAFVVSLAIWFYAASRLKEEFEISVPLSVEVPKGFLLLHQSQDQVGMRIAGPRLLVARLRTESALGYLKMSRKLTEEELKAGRMTLKVDPAWLQISESEVVQLKVSHLVAEEVTVYASPLIQRMLPVEPQLSGEPRAGFKIVDKGVVPSRVTVRGPQGVVEKMTHIRTWPLEIWNVDSDLSRPVLLLAEETVELDQGLKKPVTLELSTDTVTVNIAVKAQEDERRVDGVQVACLVLAGFPYQVEIEKKSVSVVARGMPQNLERLQAESLTAYVDLRGLASEKIAIGDSAHYYEQIKLRLPDGIPLSSARPDPDVVTITLKNPGGQLQ